MIEQVAFEQSGVANENERNMDATLFTSKIKKNNKVHDIIPSPLAR